MSREKASLYLVTDASRPRRDNSDLDVVSTMHIDNALSYMMDQRPGSSKGTADSLSYDVGDCHE
jgi:hypothetical protein